MRDETNKLGLSENFTRQQVMEWLKQNLSDNPKTRYNLRLTQVDSGYTIEIYEISAGSSFYPK